MAKTRYINTRFWNDGFISNLMPYEKLLFLYFLTNEHTNICGVYELPLKIIVSETGIPKKKIEEVMPSFCGKIVYVEGWVGIKNFAKYQNSENKNVQAGIKDALKDIPKEIIKKINDLYIANEGLCIPYEDTSHLNLNSDLDSDLLNSSPQTAELKKIPRHLRERFNTPSKIFSAEQLLAEEIVKWAANPKITMGLVMKMQKTKGSQYVRDCWAQAKDSNADDKVALFLWYYGRTKVVTEKVGIEK